jgi:exonuclease SbcC
MNKKIKSVSVEAFRGYDAKQCFNFVDSHGLPANLNVLYAPNGFGKTSFLDAVEWALTGQITRFQKAGRDSRGSNVLFNTADRHAGKILNNYESAISTGTVTIQFDDDTSISRETKLTRREHRKWDLNPGDLKDSNESLSLNTLSGYRIVDTLTQESTDQAVCFTTPEERFDALKRFWDSNNDTEIYKAILGMSRAARERQKELELEVERLSKEISTNLRLQGVNSLLNEQVRSLNKLTASKLDNFQEDISPELLNKRLEVYITLRNSYLKELSDLNVISSSLSPLELEFENYNNNLLTIKNLDAELSALASTQIDIKALNDAYDKLDSLIKRRASEIITINNLNSLYNILPDFISAHTAIKNNESNIEKINTNISKRSEAHAEHVTHVSKIRNESLNQQAFVDGLMSRITSFKDTYGNLNNLLLEQETVEKQIIQAQTLLEEKRSIVNQLTSSINTLDSYLSPSRASIEANKYIDNKELSDYYSNLRSNLEILSVKEQALTDAEDNLKKLKDVMSTLKDITDLGRHIIISTRSNTCPLCKTQYESFNQLLDKVNLEHSSNSDNVDLDHYKSGVVLAQEEYNKSLTIYTNAINSLIQTRNQDLLKQRNDLSSLDSNAVLLNRSLNNIKYDLARLEKFLRAESDLLDLQDIPAFISSLEAELSVKKEALNKLLEEVVKNEKVSQSFLDEIAFLENLIQKHILDSSVKRVLPEYIDGLELLDKTNTSIADTQKLNGRIEKSRDIIEGLINLIDIEELTIKSCLEKTQDRTSEEIEIETSYLLSHKSIISKEIDLYRSNWQSVIMDSNPQFRLADIAKRNIEISEKLNNLNSIVSKLNDLIDFVESSRKGAELIDQLNLKKDQLAKVHSATVELDSAKQKSSFYIKEKIAREFNEELINEIYQKVEPHPTLKKIKFVPDLDGDRARLDILVKHDSISDDNRAPVVYFSSAQINILSLSIFLAKSLQNDSKVINTIFMDDPIQFLDSINTLSFIDLIRMVISKQGLNQQMFISTHDENFFKLLKRKIDPDFYSANYMELETFGMLKKQI